MLLRSARKIPPSFVLLLVFLVFLGWQLSQGPSHEELPPPPPPDVPAPPPVEAEQKPHEEEKKPLRIAVVTFVTDQRSYLHLSLKNKDHYSRRHGYDFITDFEAHSERGPVYWKFDMVERLVKTGKYDWIWWLDFDTLITDTGVRVADIITDELDKAENPDQVDYILTHDCNGLNLGSFAVRGHERSLEFLRRALELRDEAKNGDEHKNYSEQDAMVELLKEDPYSGRHVVAPQSKLNAFPKDIPCFENEDGEWKPGKFLLHFAGAWAHVKGEDPTGQLMKKYEGNIIWGDWKEFY
jgi:mannan polymerase II complex MNN10 subunit